MREAFKRFRRGVRALVSRRALDREMDDEMRLHVELETEELVRAGMPPIEARRRARLAFGGVERFKEEARDGRGSYFLDRTLRELRLSLRSLRRNPGFAAVVVLTISLAIAASTATFALLERIVLRPLPYPASERIVQVTHDGAGSDMADMGLSSGAYLHYVERSGTFQALATYQETVLNLSSGMGSAERIHVTMAGPELFDVLGIHPVVGRAFTAADARGSFMNLNWTIPVVIGHELWQRRFGGDSAIVGRVIRVNDRPREVIGVLPPRLAFPEPRAQLWMLFIPEASRASMDGPGSSVVGRLRYGVTPATAEAELRALLPSIVGRFRDATAERLAEMRPTPRVTPLREIVVGEDAPVLWALFGGVLVLLLVAIMNVANLFLVRAGQRSREIAVRRAIGARSADVTRLFMTESAMLFLAGSIIGLMLANAALAMLVRASPIELPRLQEVRLDGWALAFAATVAILGTLACGAPGALRWRRDIPMDQPLRATGAVGLGRRGRRARAILVAAQLSLTLALLTCAGLMARSVAHLARVPLGFDEAGLLTVEIGLPYAKAGRYQAVYSGLLQRVRAIPGVGEAAMASDVPLSGIWGNSVPVFDVASGEGENVPRASLVFHSPDYLDVMQTRVAEGAMATPGGSAVSHPVLVSAALSRRLFRGGESVGREIRRMDLDGELDPRQPSYTVVGVVEDVRQRSLSEAPAEVVYVPLIDPPVDPFIVPTEMTVVVRTTLAPESLVADVRRVIADYDASLSVARVRSMESMVAASSARSTFLALLLAGGSLTTLLIGAIGIWGMVGYAVRQRIAEIGLRLALGASTRSVTTLFLRDALAITLAGAAAGVVLSLVAGRVLRALLFMVSPADPVTLLAATILLVVVGLLAGYLPARRAARVDPAVALKVE